MADSTAESKARPRNRWEIGTAMRALTEDDAAQLIGFESFSLCARYPS